MLVIVQPTGSNRTQRARIADLQLLEVGRQLGERMGGSIPERAKAWQILRRCAPPNALSYLLLATSVVNPAAR